MNIHVVSVQAGLGTPSTTGRLADLIEAAVEHEASTTGASTTLTRINVRDVAVKIAQATVSGVRDEALENALAAVASADILIAASPTFNASYSGLFKSFFDLVEPAQVEGTPVILAATGGTSRHSLITEFAMRPLFTYLHANPVTTAVYASTDDFATGTELRERSSRAARDALSALGAAAPASAPGPEAKQSSAEPLESSPVGDFTPFDHIARQLRK